MFGLHIHKWTTVDSLALQRSKYGVVTQMYIIHLMRCEICRKMKSQKVKL